MTRTVDIKGQANGSGNLYAGYTSALLDHNEIDPANPYESCSIIVTCASTELEYSTHPIRFMATSKGCSGGRKYSPPLRRIWTASTLSTW